MMVIFETSIRNFWVFVKLKILLGGYLCFYVFGWNIRCFAVASCSCKSVVLFKPRVILTLFSFDFFNG